MRRKGFVLMTGPIGTGKTTVVHMALQILTEGATTNHPISSAFILNPTLSREDFLEMILTEFEVPCTGTSKPARLSALHKMLLETQCKGGTSLLLVDEAHLLSQELLEEIRLLSNADSYHEKLLQIVLCGQPELLDILHKPEMRALRQRIASNCSLRPLSFAEVSAYIGERMESAGFRGMASPFSFDVVERIFHLTGGVPRLINLLSDACLTIGYKLNRPVLDLGIVNEAAAELGLSQTRVEAEVAAQAALSGNGMKEVARDPGIGSALHVLVQAMKRRCAFVPPSSAIRGELGITEHVGVGAGSSYQQEPSGDRVVVSAIDTLIQAMKLRRTSALGL